MRGIFPMASIHAQITIILENRSTRCNTVSSHSKNSLSLQARPGLEKKIGIFYLASASSVYRATGAQSTKNKLSKAAVMTFSCNSLVALIASTDKPKELSWKHCCSLSSTPLCPQKNQLVAYFNPLRIPMHEDTI